MRKTRVRRRFKKRSATTRKTRRNIHKSKKHINSRRYSRRRVMRGGGDDENEETLTAEPAPLEINNETFSPLNVLSNGDYILIGYGDLNVNYRITGSNDFMVFNISKSGRKAIKNSFILYNKTNKKYYYYSYAKNDLIEIEDKKINLQFYFPFFISPNYHAPTNDISKYDTHGTFKYNKDYYEKIKAFFESHTNIHFPKIPENFNMNVKSRKIDEEDKNRFIISIGNIYFYDFHLPNSDTTRKTVYAYGFVNIGANEIFPKFIFKDDEGKYYLNISHPIEKRSDELDDRHSGDKSIIKIVSPNEYDTFVRQNEDSIDMILDDNINDKPIIDISISKLPP